MVPPGWPRQIEVHSVGVFGVVATKSPGPRVALITRPDSVRTGVTGTTGKTSVVQLLETSSGERLVRFAYSTDGTARRGPVTLRERDVARLRAGLATRPALAEALAL